MCWIQTMWHVFFSTSLPTNRRLASISIITFLPPVISHLFGYDFRFFDRFTVKFRVTYIFYFVEWDDILIYSFEFLFAMGCHDACVCMWTRIVIWLRLATPVPLWIHWTNSWNVDSIFGSDEFRNSRKLAFS